MQRSHYLKTIRRVTLSGLAVVSCLHGMAAEWQSLFDGKTLDGWVQRGGKATYAVRDGTIVGGTVPGTPNSFLCTTQDYGDFILEVEFKVDPRLNSGIQIRSHSREKFRGGVVHGYQVEIDPSIRSYSGGIYDESSRGWLQNLADNKEARLAFKQGEWNQFRVEAMGDSIKTWINGVPAADLRDSLEIEGFIALQVHGNPSKTPIEVAWRNVRIQNLGRHEWKPLFNGTTLEGWHTLPGGSWKVTAGMIVGTSPSSEPRHGLLVTDRQFEDFTVRCQFRVHQGDSGFYFRSEEVKGNVGVHGFQVEVDTSYETGGLYETGGRAWVVQYPPDQKTQWYKQGEWNDLSVSAHGRDVVVHMNGLPSAELKDDPGRAKGHIALQLHGGQDMHVEFRKIEMLVPER